MTSDISLEIAANHKDCSQAFYRFLEFVQDNPEAAERLDAGNRNLFSRKYDYDMQSWPVMIDKRKRAEVGKATVRVTDLIKRIPELLFNNDPQRMAEFYGFSNPLDIQLLLTEPTGLESLIARCDFVDSPERGFRCLEVNISANLGGWQIYLWPNLFRDHPFAQRFTQQEGIELHWRDPIQILLVHIVEDTLDQGLADDVLNIAIAVPLMDGIKDMEAFFNERYAAVTQKFGITGTVSICYYPDGLFEKDTLLYAGETRIHALLEYTDSLPPDFVYRLFKAGAMSLYNSPINQILGDKRNLALLSQNEDNEVFTEKERAAIKAHIPWSREVKAVQTDYFGETHHLPDLLLKHRAAFVIKDGVGYGGEDVLVGKFKDDATWSAGVQRALDAGTWVVQEYLPSKTYMFQHGDRGWAPHDLIWGLFAFGHRYAGGFMRSMAHSPDQDGVINSARGATESYLFEVKEVEASQP